MNKVISINLNGTAYQLEEQGFEALDAYLREARYQLANNPDLEEILTDLEQAIADKCNRFIRSGKTVVLSNEVDQIIEEMGPVRDSRDDTDEAGADTGQAFDSEDSKDNDTGPGASARKPRKLYRLKDDKMVEGICSGIAAYLGIDPTIVRIIFVVLLIYSGGVAAIIYLAMALFIPEAKTPEEYAAAHGAPFDARDVIERAKSKFQDLKDNAGKTRKQKANVEYAQRHKREKVNSGLSTVITILLFIVGVSLLLNFLRWPPFPDFMFRWPFFPDFMHSMGIHFYPWVSILVLIVLIFVLGKLIKNISSSGNGGSTLIAGIMKFCLVVLVLLFAIQMFPVVFWIIREIVSAIRHLLFPFHW
jgi:phage shock protein PspC (stress-responsive transcriptional regulator)